MININTLLENIFNNSNQINYQNNEVISLSNNFDDIKNEAINWISFFKDKKNGEILLPFINNNEYYWYSCTNEKTNAKRINDELNSFVSSYANISPIKEDIKPHEEKLISIFGNNNVLKITPNENFKKEFLNSVSQYRKLLEKKPKRNKKIVREFSLIRSDFEKALSVNNKFEAERALEEMRRTGRLDKTNQIFLEIYMNSKLGQIDKILEHPYFTDIIKCKMPKQILSSILEAIYLKYFYSYELNSDFTSILKVFKEDILYPYKDLLKSRKNINNPYVIKIFFIKELSNNEINYDNCIDLINEYPLFETNGALFLNNFLSFIKDKTEIKTTPVLEKDEYTKKYNLALETFENEDFDNAFKLILDLEFNEKLVKNLLSCIEEIDSNETNKIAWDYIQKVDNSIIENLPSKSSKLYKKLKEKMESNIDSYNNLHEILNYYLESKDVSKTKELVNSTIESWKINYYLEKNENMLGLTSILDNLVQDSNGLFIYKDYLLSKIVELFFSNFSSSEQVKVLGNSICVHFTFFETINKLDLEIYQDICNYILNMGLNDKQFGDIMDSLIYIFDKSSSVQNINWFIDTIEIISCYSNNKRKEKISSFFIGTLLPFISQNKHRIESWSTIEQLGKDFDVYDSFIKNIIPINDDTLEEKTSEILRGKLVSIYTLTDQVAYRAKSKIEKLYPGVTVKINNDKGETDALKNLARSSDIFIFCWRSSKHQAFFSIKHHLRNKDSFIQPEGKGSDSIIRRLNHYIESKFEEF